MFALKGALIRVIWRHGLTKNTYIPTHLPTGLPTRVTRRHINVDPEFKTIFVTRQLRVTVDSIRDVLDDIWFTNRTGLSSDQVLLRGP